MKKFFSGIAIALILALGISSIAEPQGVYRERLRVLGSGTNDSAAAGYVGEIQEAQLLAASATSLTTLTAKTVTSKALGPGSWMCQGYVHIIATNAATSFTLTAAGISQTDNTLPGDDGWQLGGFHAAVDPGATNGINVSAGIRVVRVAAGATTTVYLVGIAAFDQTATASGKVSCLRFM